MALKLLCNKESPTQCEDVYFKLESVKLESGTLGPVFLVACNERGTPFGRNGRIFCFTSKGEGYRWKGGLKGAPEWVLRQFKFDGNNSEYGVRKR